jgi:hypothetical protein
MTAPLLWDGRRYHPGVPDPSPRRARPSVPWWTAASTCGTRLGTPVFWLTEVGAENAREGTQGSNFAGRKLVTRPSDGGGLPGQAGFLEGPPDLDLGLVGQHRLGRPAVRVVADR